MTPILTSNCLTAFEKWFLLSDYREQVAELCKLKIAESISESLYKFPDTFLLALYVEFFDSVGIYVNAVKYDVKWSSIADYARGMYLTRQEALKAAIISANSIFNGK